jgi:hypothetical protein
MFNKLQAPFRFLQGLLQPKRPFRHTEEYGELFLDPQEAMLGGKHILKDDFVQLTSLNGG